MLHIELDRDLAHHPYYLQILEQIRSSILAGELAAGSQLPPSRQLAIELGIARRTVTIAAFKPPQTKCRGDRLTMVGARSSNSAWWGILRSRSVPFGKSQFTRA